MKLAKKREAGQIFVLVLILLALGPLLVIPMLHLSYSNQKYTQITEVITENAYAADSGIEYAKYQIFNFPSDVQASGLDENLVINGIDVHVTAEFEYELAAYRITSTAARAQRSSTIECLIVIDVGLFGKVAACDGNLNIQYCQFVNGDYPGESDVFVNGDVSLSGSAADRTLIDGDITASGTVTLFDRAEVTGTIREGATMMEFPPINTEVHEEKAKEGGTCGTLTLTDGGTYYLGPKYIDGDLTIGHANKVTDVYLEGTVYVTGTVTITGVNQPTTLKGFGDILAGGNIDVGRATFALDIGEFLPLLLSVNGNISITGARNKEPYVQAIIYAPAPDSQLTLSWVDAFGSMAARTINLSHASLEYPAELRGRADLPGSGLDTVIYLFK